MKKNNYLLISVCPNFEFATKKPNIKEINKVKKVQKC